MTSNPSFDLGRICATPGMLAALDDDPRQAGPYLKRHHHGDWGDLCPEDHAANDSALKEDLRLLSAYHLPDGTKFWIITEWDRSTTTLLLPEEY